MLSLCAFATVWVHFGPRSVVTHAAAHLVERSLCAAPHTSSRAGQLACAEKAEEKANDIQIRWESADGVRTLVGVQPGELLRTALLRRGVSPHNYNSKLINCRGLGTCGTCAVQVEGSVLPANRTAVEDVRLSLPPHGSAQSASLRLACQCTIGTDSVTVRKFDGFWGSKASLAPASAGKTYFGDLEYVLDRKSPPRIPCAACTDSKVVDCSMCDGWGTRGPEKSICPACRGSGHVVCRACFSGDPFSLSYVRDLAAKRPD
mmetsp:Transcript_26754/g.58740  ORF Transcript_26754/g.58740 Transcript_26754/m.58740 type:complete len:261 (+) Transcript_26754:179-961(+)|eukprot:6189696-Pleurochrysis_carterae.AAC.1